MIGTNCFPTGLVNKSFWQERVCLVVMGVSSPKNIGCDCDVADVGGGKGRGVVVPGSWTLVLIPMKLLMMSMGTGKMMVELFSAEMLLRVCRYRNWKKSQMFFILTLATTFPCSY